MLEAGIQTGPDLHVYAHCQRGVPGGVAILVINADRTAAQSLDVPMKGERYTLTARELTSPRVDLNGKQLEMGKDDTFPKLEGVTTRAGLLEFSPASITFLTVAEPGTLRVEIEPGTGARKQVKSRRGDILKVAHETDFLRPRPNSDRQETSCIRCSSSGFGAGRVWTAAARALDHRLVRAAGRLGGDGGRRPGDARRERNEASAKKIRRLYQDKVLAGFAGSTADAFSLFGRFETKLEQYAGNLGRSAVELAKDWRTDRCCGIWKRC